MKKINLKNIRSKSIKAIELQGGLLAKNMKLKDAGFNSKTFHYWKMNGLISFVFAGRWAEISFIEYLWLKVLESMQGFGCSLRIMQNIYYEQFIKAYEENLGKKTLIDNIAYYRSLKKIRELSKEEQNLLAKSEENLNDPLIDIALRTEISYFYQIVLKTINEGIETGIVIYQDDTYVMIKGDNEFVDRDKPHIYIPLKYFIADLFTKEDKAEFVKNLNIFSDDEIRLLKELRANNVEKVTITYDSEARKVKKIEYDKTGLINGDKAKEVMRILGMQNYSGFKLKTRTGTSLSYTKTETKNFK